MDTDEALSIIGSHLRKAEQCGLTTEVVTSALAAMKADPSLSPVEVIRIGMHEWDII